MWHLLSRDGSALLVEQDCVSAVMNRAEEALNSMDSESAVPHPEMSRSQPVRAAGQGELVFLIALIGEGDSIALTRFLDLTYSMLERWLSTGIISARRRDDVLVQIFIAVWGRAGEYRPTVMGPIQWLQEIVSGVLRSAG